MDSIEKIRDAILDSDDILICAHTEPDGDAIGSVAALYLVLKKLGKNVCAVLEKINSKLMSIEGAELILDEVPADFKHKTFIALDCASKKRLNKFEGYFDMAETTINIDHHISNDCFAGVNYVKADASATCEIVYSLLSCSNDFVIDEAIASALYAGILYDTGGFRHPTTSDETFFTAGKLVRCGANASLIQKNLFGKKKYEELQITATAISRMKLECDGKLAYTYITNDDFAQTGAKPGDIDTIVDYVMSVKTAIAGAFIYPKGKNVFKASLRSEGSINVNEIAEKLGGGGHKNAAGALLNMTLDDSVKTVINEMKLKIGDITNEG